MTEENTNLDLTKVPETGMAKQAVEELMRDDRPQFITILHGVSEAAMKGIDGARAGDYFLGGCRRIPAASFGPGFRALPIDVRPQAVYFEGNEAKKKTNIQGSAVWNEIAAMAAGFKKGAKVGFEFLLVLPDYKCMGILYLANEERRKSAPKVLQALHEKRAVQFSTIIKGAKNMVNVTVEPARWDVGDWMPKPEVQLQQVAAFNAYKKVTAAPSGPER